MAEGVEAAPEELIDARGWHAEIVRRLAALGTHEVLSKPRLQNGRSDAANDGGIARSQQFRSPARQVGWWRSRRRWRWWAGRDGGARRLGHDRGSDGWLMYDRTARRLRHRAVLCLPAVVSLRALVFVVPVAAPGARTQSVAHNLIRSLCRAPGRTRYTGTRAHSFGSLYAMLSITLSRGQAPCQAPCHALHRALSRSDAAEFILHLRPRDRLNGGIHPRHHQMAPTSLSTNSPS